MKQIFLDIQDRLSTIEGLRYIDKDWGQLEQEQPAVQFPCALIDVETVTYTNRGDSTQLADAVLYVRVAGLRLSQSSSKSSSRESAWKTLDMCRAVNDHLHLWHTERFSKLIRTGLRKVSSSPGYDCYELSYHLTYWDSLSED